MTAKTNVNAVVAAAAVEVDDTHKSKLTLDASDAMERSQIMQHGTSRPQHQASLAGNEINNDREEICSRKRSLGKQMKACAPFVYCMLTGLIALIETLINDDVESAASHEDEDHGFGM